MNFKHFKRHWLLPSTVAFAMAVSLPLFDSSTISQANSTSTSHDNNQTVYKVDRYGFQFSYAPTQFVVVSQSLQSSDYSMLQTINIWTKQHYQMIKSVSEYQGDYPPNVTISVHRNSQQLALKQWIQRNDWLVDAKNFQEQTIAGRKGLFFTARGLYEQDHLIFQHPSNSNIILISFAKTNVARNDAAYRKAFNEAIGSLKLTAVSQPNKEATQVRGRDY